MSRADFVEMTTTAIAGTLGNGAVTCIAVSGLPTFTNAFGSPARCIDYVIEDTAGLRFEKGYGTISANVLTRTNVHETWDGTTYATAAPTPLQFGTSPTSGNIRIRIAPTSDQFMPVSPAICPVTGDDLGAYLLNATTPASNNGTNDEFDPSNDYYMPYLNLVRGAISGIMVKCLNSNAGAGIKLSLYEVDTDGYPGPRIVTFNTIPLTASGTLTDTATGTWSPAGAIRIGVGWFYLGSVKNDTTAKVRCTNQNPMIGGPTIRQGGYGFPCCIYKPNELGYTTGLPTGTPGKTGYTTTYASNVGIAAGLRITN